MNRQGFPCILVLSLLCAGAARAGAQLVVRPVPMPQPAVTDEQIGTAILRGAEFLLNQFDERGQIKKPLELDAERAKVVPPNDRSMQGGHQVLCIYAILAAGQAVRDERLSVRGKTVPTLIDTMKNANIAGFAETYARGIRATALALNNRREDREALLADVRYLLENVHGGAYTYGRAPYAPDPLPPQYRKDITLRIGDNSNSQYGLLGVWSGAEVGVEVPVAYWQLVEAHWTVAQLADGQWRYNLFDPPPGTPVDAPQGLVGSFNMTVAGLASLFVTHDWLLAPRFGNDVGRPPLSPALARGMQWLESGDNCISLNNGYGMYGLERVGLASGYKYFGRHDWYAEHAAAVVPQLLNLNPQGDSMLVAYWVLFLARGRHPIMANKLRFDGAWANRPRDLANLSRFAGRELERPLNWQVVSIDREWQDWADAPILCLSSHERPKLKEADYAKIRNYIDAGGLLLMQSDGGRAAFTTFAMDLGHKLYPQYEWKDLPADHPIYTVNYKVNPRPRLKCLSNGLRLLMLHSAEDLSAAWQMRAEKTRRNAFELGVNLFIYLAGRTDLRNRLASPYIPEPPAAQKTLAVARVQYAGNWDPEPYAMTRFARWFGFQTGLGLQATAVAAEKLDAAQHPVALLTGNARFTPREPEVASLRRYVESGGLLMIDACGSAADFDASVLRLLAGAFPQAKLSPMPEGHAVLSRDDGMGRLPEPALRPATPQRPGGARPEWLRSGKGAVIYSPYDVTTGLLDMRGRGLSGFQPAHAQRMMKNVILWGWEGCPD